MQAESQTTGLLNWRRSIHSPNSAGAFLLLLVINVLVSIEHEFGALDALI